MNATINGIIDVLFKDTADTAETRALHEELLNNCLEHYNDLIGRGLSETEAIDAVVESLKGMKEVIDEYPKKKNTATEETIEVKPDAEEPDKEGVSGSEKPEEPDGKDRAFECSDVHTIRTDLRNGDLEIGYSDDGLIHVRCEEPEQIICEKAGGRLTVRYSETGSRKATEEWNMKPEDISLKGVFSFVSKVLNKVAAEITVNGSKVRIEIPEGYIDELNLNSTSGNITLDEFVTERINLHTTSGDIDVKAGKSAKAKIFSASTASGDISFKGNADQAETNSISGDVTLEGDYLTVRMKSTSGDTTLNGCARDISMSSISGDNKALIGNTDVERINAASTSGDIEIELAEGSGNIHVMMKTVSGDTSCRYTDDGDGARIRIQARTVSGDIRIR